MSGIERFRPPLNFNKFNFVQQPYPNISLSYNSIFTNGNYIFALASGGSNGFARWGNSPVAALPSIQVAGAGRPIPQLPLSGLSVGCAATGGRIVAADNLADIYTSDDDGVSWQLRSNAPTANFGEIVLGPPNTLIAFSITAGNNAWISTDNGDTWIPTGFSFNAVAVSGFQKCLYASEIGVWFFGSASGHYAWSLNGTVWNQFFMGAAWQIGAATFYEGNFYLSFNSLVTGPDRVRGVLSPNALGNMPTPIPNYYDFYAGTGASPQGRVFWEVEDTLFLGGTQGFIEYLDTDGLWKPATTNFNGDIRDALATPTDVWLCQGSDISKTIRT